MQKGSPIQKFENTRGGEARMAQSDQQEGQRPSGPSPSRWTDSEIRIFLMEWEPAEQEVGHPGRKIHKKTRALCQRLFQRGLKHTCFDLLVSLKNLNRTLGHERPLLQMVFPPHVEALYTREAISCTPGPQTPGKPFPSTSL